MFGADEVVLVRSGDFLCQHDAVPVQVGVALEGAGGVALLGGLLGHPDGVADLGP